jgi:hypothetical protein
MTSKVHNFLMSNQMVHIVISVIQKANFMVSTVLMWVKVCKDKYVSQVPADTSCYKCSTVHLLIDSLQ